MARKKPLQTNFSSGQISEQFQLRRDTQQYNDGAKSLLNMRCLVGGGITRRPGSWWIGDLPGPSRLHDFVVDQATKYVLAFSNGQVNAYLEDGTAAGSATGPWTSAIFLDMDVTQSGNTMFITHPTMWPQVLTRTGAATWTVSNYTFATGSAGRLEQPYFKVVSSAITLQPSALTGSITLTVSSAVFTASHVGQYIRYLSKACLITAVAGDGLSCTATVVETLPDTQTLTVTSTAKFAVGEVVQGSTTGAKGQVVTVTDATHMDVVITDKLIVFAAETIVGPNGSTTISAVAATVTKAAVTDWDEQLFGPVYGYPAVVALHRNRLCFGGHLTVPNALICSALDALYDFNVGDGSDGDAIFALIGDAGASTITALHSAEQLLIGTDKGMYYVPEGQNNAFRPTSVGFAPFGSPWAITKTAKPRPYDNGVLFVSGSLVVKARPTGNLTQSWDAEEVSLLGSDMISAPTELCVVSNIADGPERYAIALNDDSKIAVLQLVQDQKIRNVAPWNTDGTFMSLCGINDKLFAAVRRSIAGNTVYTLELFDQDVTLDCATEYADLAVVPADYGSTTVNVRVGRYHLGTYPLTVTSPPAGPYQVGLMYETEVETLPPAISDSRGDYSGDKMRIVDSIVFVKDSQRFAVNGEAFAAYDVTDDLSEPPPVKDGPLRVGGLLGWRREPTLIITQPDPLPLTILGIKTVVAY